MTSVSHCARNLFKKCNFVKVKKLCVFRLLSVYILQQDKISQRARAFCVFSTKFIGEIQFMIMYCKKHLDSSLNNDGGQLSSATQF